VYTSLIEAKKEVWKRWRDVNLRRRVTELVGSDIPDVFLKEPRAVIFRNVISPTHECLKFLELAEKIGLAPLGLEYLDDRFCTRSVDKLGLGKLRIFQGRDKNGAAITRCEKIIDIKSDDNKMFNQIQTDWGENLVDFHRALAEEHAIELEVFDLSGWIQRHSATARENYRNMFALFTCFGIQLENFVTNDSASAEFVARVAYPAFNEVRDELGVSPLIVPIYTEEDLRDISCWSYPGSALAAVMDRRVTGKMKRLLVGLFLKYCTGCEGRCCKEEITAFKSEIQRLPFRRDASRAGCHNEGACGVAHIDMLKKCRFLNDGDGCQLDLWIKPLDCLSYPIYPIVEYRDNDSKDIVGLMVHRNCPSAEMMAHDSELLESMKAFWERELSNIDSAEVQAWFGYENKFWHNKNLIILNV
jgi:hypothetical protein